MQLMLGDCLERMKEIPDNSVDSIVTDAPYGLSFMGKSWDYDVPAQNIWEQCLRVLKPGGHLLAFFGTRTYHRGVIKIEDAGFEIRDQIMWIYGSGFPKSHNLKEEWLGWGTALKPANEPIVVARKPLEKGLTVAQNVLKWGTGALNIDGSRIATDRTREREYDKEASSGKTGSNKAMFAMGDNQPRSDKWLNQGRWPANIIFDEEAAKVLDEQSGRTRSSSGVKKKNDAMTVNFKGGLRARPGVIEGHTDSGGASRFFYVAKASKSERNAGLEGMPQKKNDFQRESSVLSKSNGELGKTKPNENFHPTVKPLKLGTYLQNLVTPPGGVTLDPFMGSGSFGVSAKAAGFKFIGIERDESYFEIAQRRIING